jgi:hypothetical protein
MKNISTGTGLVALALGIAVHPILSGLAVSARASSEVISAAAVTAAATAQAGGAPTIVWFGVTQWSGSRDFYRLWSDGRLEYRTLYNGVTSGWTEVPAPPGGNGFACRADINGDRVIDGADLTFVLSSWGQQGSCEPEATYPCLDLGNLVGNVAVK